MAYAKKLLNERDARLFLLTGELGSGKTTFVRGLARALGIKEPITSPTYTYMKSYQLQATSSKFQALLHFDLYRLPENPKYAEKIMAEIGLEEALQEKNVIIAIEWAERLPLLNDMAHLKVHFETRKNTHQITLLP